MSTPRIDFYNASPAAIKAMLSLEGSVGKLGLEPSLLELVKMRASQLNGCAFCLDMHSRAALAWTEALTLITDGHAGDADYAQARAEFSEAELVNLTLAITTINAWNRFAIGFRSPLPAER